MFRFIFVRSGKMSAKREKKKVPKKLAPVASAAAVDEDDDKENDEKQTRSARFTAAETDLVLDLWMNSALSSAQTNKLSPYGRLQTFDDIARMFNQSPVIVEVFRCWFFYYFFLLLFCFSFGLFDFLFVVRNVRQRC